MRTFLVGLIVALGSYLGLGPSAHGPVTFDGGHYTITDDIDPQNRDPLQTITDDINPLDLQRPYIPTGIIEGPDPIPQRP